MTSDDSRLDALFARYGAACPDPEPSVDFMPRLWARIEAPRSFSFAFQRLGRFLLTGSAVACLLLGALNFMPHASLSSTRGNWHRIGRSSTWVRHLQQSKMARLSSAA